MKRPSLWGIALACTMASCSFAEDYSYNDLNETNLNGQWQLVNLVSEYGEISTTNTNDSLATTYATVGIAYNLKMQFDTPSKSFTSTGTYTVETIITNSNGSKDTLITVNSFPETGEWQLNNEQLILNLNEETRVYDVVLFADNALGFKRSTRNEIPLDNQSIISEGEINYTWVKETPSDN